HALIIGEHGDSEFPVWSQSSIGPIPVKNWSVNGQGITEHALAEIALAVKNAAYKVIEGKGATNFAIGLSGARIVQAILRDENAILPVSSVVHGYHGVEDVALSVPTVVNSRGADRTLLLELTDAEIAKLQDSAKALNASLVNLGLK
ncbi:MAG: L-lactate dehydrogenase, partial [Micrococcales bacterium]